MERDARSGASELRQTGGPDGHVHGKRCRNSLPDRRGSRGRDRTAGRAIPPVPGVAAFRLPGQCGLERKRMALAEGVTLYPGILEGLAASAEKFAITPPGCWAVVPSKAG